MCLEVTLKSKSVLLIPSVKSPSFLASWKQLGVVAASRSRRKTEGVDHKPVNLIVYQKKCGGVGECINPMRLGGEVCKVERCVL